MFIDSFILTLIFTLMYQFKDVVKALRQDYPLLNKQELRKLVSGYLELLIGQKVSYYGAKYWKKYPPIDTITPIPNF